MGARHIVGSVGATATIALATLGTAPSAYAGTPNLNGPYKATSNGQFARTNEVFKDERTKVETWAITTVCKSPIECTGEVQSSAGWTAPVIYNGDVWNIRHVIPNWEPCPDGTFADGVQQFFFWSYDPVTNERHDTQTGLLVGRDMTLSASGSCGRNQSLQIELPFRLDKL
jgi:hypothetical protein